jgi:hypothetical protein
VDARLPAVPDTVAVGFLGLSPMVPSTPFPESAALAEAGLDGSLALLQAIGATGISGGLGGPSVKGYDGNGQIIVDFGAADTTFDKIAQVLGDATARPDLTVNTYGGLQMAGIPTTTSTWNVASMGDLYSRLVRRIAHCCLTSCGLSFSCCGLDGGAVVLELAGVILGG